MLAPATSDGRAVSRPSRARVILALALVVGLGPAAAARADYADAFRRGMTAVEEKRWAEVTRFMQQALDENPREGGQVKLYGMRFAPYLPHFYLGLAAFNRGDCSSALSSWKQSEAQGAVAKTKEARTLEQLRDQCREQLASTATPATPPTTVAAAVPPRPTPMPSATALPRATATPATPAPTPRPTAPAATPAATAAAAATRPPALTPVRRAPEPRLLAGARAHFAGRHREAIVDLEPDPGWTAQSRAQAHLLRASARFSLHALGGQPESLLQQAGEDVRRCRTLAPTLTPDTRAFSPRFVRFFESTRP